MSIERRRRCIQWFTMMKMNSIWQNVSAFICTIRLTVTPSVDELEYLPSKKNDFFGFENEITIECGWNRTKFRQTDFICTQFPKTYRSLFDESKPIFAKLLLKFCFHGFISASINKYTNKHFLKSLFCLFTYQSVTMWNLNSLNHNQQYAGKLKLPQKQKGDKLRTHFGLRSWLVTVMIWTGDALHWTHFLYILSSSKYWRTWQ